MTDLLIAFVAQLMLGYLLLTSNIDPGNKSMYLVLCGVGMGFTVMGMLSSQSKRSVESTVKSRQNQGGHRDIN